MMSPERLLAVSTVLLGLLGAATAAARCVDVVDLQSELPNDLVTANSTGVSYSYDLENEQYSISWTRSGQTGGPHGPFTLTRGCVPAMVKWESLDFLLLQAGCGTFCWYALVLPLGGDIRDPMKIERPLAFDQSRNLLAYYRDKRVIGIKNLMTGQQQEFRTVRECESASELCVHAVRFTDDRLEYTESGVEQRPLSVRLDARLLGH